MKLVITEKNIAADKIAQLLSDGLAPKKDTVYKTPCYYFKRNGEDWVSIGLKGHIMSVEFPDELSYTKKQGWFAQTEAGDLINAEIPSELPHPPFPKGRRAPLSDTGVKLKTWSLKNLKYLAWAPIVKTPAEKEIIRALKSLAKKSDEIIIATDFDREGELIGLDAYERVREVNADAPIYRARYSAITKQEIQEAFTNLCELDVNLAAAGDTRRYIDLIWGLVLTRYLTKVRENRTMVARSAGRVQSPALAIVCKREEERRAFVPEKYWQIKAELADSDAQSSDKDKEDSDLIVKAMHARDRFKDEAEARKAYERALSADCARVVGLEKRSRKQQPPAPFNTTSLMAAASSLGLSPARVMNIAESLYMSGFISYPRVDNTVYPKSLDLKGIVKKLSAAPQYHSYCESLLKAPLHATRGKQETTDHPPIHPVNAPDERRMKADELKLYNLIARRFLATLGDPATIEGSKLSLDLAGESFVASGDVLVDPGFRAIYPFGLKKDEQLPLVHEGDSLNICGIQLEDKQTEPPSRYSQGRLIQEMEKLGIGTKATRHSIIERLYQVNYFKNDPIEPSDLGMAISRALAVYAPDMTSAQMTAELESEMTSIAEGKLDQHSVVQHSRALLSEILDKLLLESEEMSESIAEAVAADACIGTCPNCGADLQIKSSAKNRQSFIGCSAWPACELTYPLPTGQIERVDEPCPICDKPQIMVKQFRRKPFVQCVDPRCPSNRMEPVDLGPCPECLEAGRDGHLIAQKSLYTGKRFIKCSKKDEGCELSYPLPPEGEIRATGRVCEHCGAPIVDVVNEAGKVWTICVNMQCPGKKEEAKKKTARRTSTKRAGSTKAKSGAKTTATAKKKSTKASAASASAQ